jgi:hypothetical protein
MCQTLWEYEEHDYGIVTKYYLRSNISKSTYPKNSLGSGYDELHPIRLCRVIFLQLTVKAFFTESVLRTNWYSICK